MKNQLQILLILFLNIAFGCNKSYTSYWQVNDESFSSNQTEMRTSPGGTGFSTQSRENGFEIAFHRNGVYDIGGGIPFGQGGIDLSFYYHNKMYKALHPGSTQMRIFDKKDKTMFSIPPTWFIRLEYDSNAVLIPNNDSVLIQGILSEP